jgi:uncharacterized protein
MGGLLRLIVLAAVVWLVISFIRRSLSGPAVNHRPESPATRMQACSHCGLNVAENECTHSNGLFFCSEAHRDAWLRKRS